jgi:hypothetical protein
VESLNRNQTLPKKPSCSEACTSPVRCLQLSVFSNNERAIQHPLWCGSHARRPSHNHNDSNDNNRKATATTTGCSSRFENNDMPLLQTTLPTSAGLNQFPTSCASGGRLSPYLYPRIDAPPAGGAQQGPGLDSQAWSAVRLFRVSLQQP